jgi:hypothetical protein
LKDPLKKGAQIADMTQNFWNIFIFLCFFSMNSILVQAQVVDAEGKEIEKSVDSESPILFSPKVPINPKKVIPFDEYGFELALPGKHIVSEELKDTMIHNARFSRTLLITVFKPDEEKDGSLRGKLANWLKDKYYNHTPFKQLAYQRGILGECYSYGQFHVALVRQFGKHLILMELSVPTGELAQKYDEIQQLLNGFQPVGTCKKTQVQEEEPKKEVVKQPTLVPLNPEVKATPWQEPTPEDRQKQIADIPGTTILEKIQYLAYTSPSTLRFSVKILGSEEQEIKVRHNEPGVLGNLSRLYILLQTCFSLSQDKIRLEEKLTFKNQHRSLESPVLGTQKEMTSFSVEFLLQALVQGDLSAYDILAERLEWKNITETARNNGLESRANSVLIPYRFYDLLRSDLITRFHSKSPKEKLESWEIAPERRKESIIESTVKGSETLAYIELEKGWKENYIPLSFENKLLISHQFGVQSTSKALITLLENMFQGSSGDGDIKASKNFLNFFKQDGKNFWASGLSSSANLTFMEGQDFGVISAMGYFNKGDKKILFVFISDSFKSADQLSKLQTNLYLIFYLLEQYY